LYAHADFPVLVTSVFVLPSGSFAVAVNCVMLKAPPDAQPGP